MQTIMRIRYKRKRSGIGNVIASMIFIFLVIFMTGNLLVWSILQFSDYQNIVQDMNSHDLLSLGENVVISGAMLDSSDNLDITVSNNGRSTAHIVSLWIINETSSDSSEKYYHFTQNIFLSSGNSLSGIGSSIKLNSTMKYTFRIITELGNIASYQIIPVSEAVMKVDVTINPPTVISEHDVFVHMIITNNMSGTGSVYNIVPDLLLDPLTFLPYKVLNLSSSATCASPTPLSVNSLPSGSTAIFDWLCTIDGQSGSAIQFNASYVNAPVGVWNNDSLLIVTGGGRSNSSSYSAVAGDVFMDFKSIQWSIRNNQKDDGPFSSWESNWQIDRTKFLVFKVNITNRGDDALTLAEETAIFFQDLAGNEFNQFFIVSGDENLIDNYDESDPIIIESDESAEIFFAVSDPGEEPGGNPGNGAKVSPGGTYNAILVIYSNSAPFIGQAIPFQAFISS